MICCDPIVTPRKYLGQELIENIGFDGLCNVFFNEVYLNYFENSKLKLELCVNSIKIFSFHKKKNIYIAIIRNGAALSSVDFECLIYLGFKEYIFYGYACSIDDRSDIGDLLLINKTFVGEGVSQYYGNHRKYTCTSESLNLKIMNKISGEHGIRYANCYTTEALFMETISFINKLKSLGINCIDMECSALSSIALLRNVRVAFVFCVSDAIKDDEWMYRNDVNLRELLVHTLFSLNVK